MDGGRGWNDYVQAGNKNRETHLVFSFQTSPLPTSPSLLTSGKTPVERVTYYMSTPSPLSAIELAASPIVDSYLRGKDFANSLFEFYRLHCPRFKTFDRDSEHDLSMTASHDEFLRSIDALVEGRLGDFSVTLERFEAALEVTISEDASSRILDMLRSYSDFAEFGEHMRDKFEEIYPALEKERVGAETTAVRVLWDIENVAIPRASSGMEVTSAIHSHAKSLVAGHVDLEVKAFYCPSKGTINKRNEKDLLDSGVVLVSVSRKREDADRRIKSALQADMRHFPQSTVFIVLTSDLDFTADFQELNNAGYQIHCVHDSSERRVVEKFSMFCHGVRGWTEVLSGVADDSEHDEDDDNDGKNIRSDENDEGIEEEKGQWTLASNRNVKMKKKGGRGSTKSFIPEQGRWYVAKCINWRASKGYGFVKLKTGEKIFCHSTALPLTAKFRCLRRGEEVEVQVQENAKGPRVKAVKPGALICEVET